MEDLKAFADYMSAKTELLEKEAQIKDLLKKEEIQEKLRTFRDFCRFNSTEKWRFYVNLKTLEWEEHTMLISRNGEDFLYPVNSYRNIEVIKISLLKADKILTLLSAL